MNQSSIIVNILINSNNQSPITNYNSQMNQIAQNAQRAASASALSFDSIFGANFFADLATRMVTSMQAGFTQLVKDAVEAAKRSEAALKGVDTLGQRVGLGKGEAADAVSNLDLVKNGLISTIDGVTALKNLLATGFSLTESIDLIKRFGDTAAFGRQASLSFGYAIASATEGIKNQNSLLVDNAGVTKNLSVILAEQGFTIQDLSDKVKGAAARQALYKGLIQETSLQLGDANKLLETTSGQLTRVESAWTKFLISLGNTIIQSTIVKTSLAGVVKILQLLEKNTAAVYSLVTAVIALTVALIAMNTAQIASLPVIGQMISSIGTLINVMFLAQGVAGSVTVTIALAALGWGALILAVGGVIAILYSYATAQEATVKISREGIEATRQQRDAAIESVKASDQLASGNLSLNESVNLQIKLYNALDITAQKRVHGTVDEAAKVAQLRIEYENLAKAKNQQLATDARITTDNLIAKAKEFNDLQIQINKNIAAGQELSAKQTGLLAGDENRTVRTTPVGIVGASSSATRNVTAGEEAMLVGRAITDLDVTYGELRKKQETAKNEGEHFYLQQKLVGSILVKTSEELIKGSLAYSNQTDKLKETSQSVLSFTTQTGLSTVAINNQTDAIERQRLALTAQIRTLEGATDAETRRKGISEMSGTLAEMFKNNPEAVKKGVTGMMEASPKLKQQIEDQRGFNRAMQEVNKILDLTPEKAKKVRTEYDSLTKGLQKLRGEVASFQDLNSREFKLRFEREELERVKRDFESILTLRRELGLPLTTPLPRNAQGAQDELKYLERIKSVRESIRGIIDETVKADDRLLVSRLAANVAVVSADVRSYTLYFDTIRKKRDAEAQLTTDIYAEIKRREDFTLNSTRTVLSAQAESYHQYLKEENDKEDTRLQQIARLAILTGATFGNNAIIADTNRLAASNPEQSPVVLRLDNTNKLLTSILAAVKPNTGSQTTYGTTNSSESGSFWGYYGDEQIPVPSQGQLIEVVSYAAGDGRPFLVPQNPVPAPEVPQTAVTENPAQTQAQIDNLEIINELSEKIFKLKVDDKKLTVESRSGLIAFLEAQKRLNEVGIEGLKNNAIGQDYLNQQINEGSTQVEQLAVAEARLNRLRAGETVAVNEVLNNAELQRRKNAEQTYAALISGERYYQILIGDTVEQVEEMRRIEEARAEAIQSQTTSAFIANANDRRFIEGVNSEMSPERQMLDEQFRAQRTANVKSLTTEIYNQNKALAIGRDTEKELLEITRQRNAEILAVGEAESALSKQRALNADPSVNAARQQTSVTKEQTDLEARLNTIMNERVSIPVNQQLREQVALEETLYDLHKKDFDAQTNLVSLQAEFQDKFVVSQAQVNEKVQEHLNQVEGMTDIYARMKTNIIDGVFGGIDSLFTRITGKIPILSRILNDFLSSMTKLLLAPFLQKLFVGGSGGGITSAGASTSGGSAGILQQILGGLRGGNGLPASGGGGGGSFSGFGGFGGTAPFNPNAFAGAGTGQATSNGLPAFMNLFNGGGGSGGNSTAGSGAGGLLQSLLSQGKIPPSGATGAIRPRIVPPGLNGSIFSQLFSGIGFGKAPGAGGALASMLPFLGISLGAQAGGGGIGSIIGGIGGGLLGAGLTAAPAALAAGGSLSGLGFLAPLFSNPVTAIAGAALLVGALVGGQALKRRKLRRQEEIQRTQILTDSKKQMQDIITQLRSGNLDGSSAIKQAETIRANYITQVSQLKDSKTRNIALATVRELDAMITTIKTEANRADYARSLDNMLVPTFSTGGYVDYVTTNHNEGVFTGMGGSSFGDTIPAFVKRDEAILTAQNINRLGGYNALRQAGVRGMPFNNQSASNQASGANAGATYTAFFLDEGGADKWLDKVKGRGIAKKLRIAVRTGDDDGLLDTFEKGLAGEF